MSDYLCSSCNEDRMVCITSAQYEALVAAAEMFMIITRSSGQREIKEVRATLRTAGIDPSEEQKMRKDKQ